MQFESLLFNPFEYEDKRLLTNEFNIDPDNNFFSQLGLTLNNLYLSEPDFRKEFDNNNNLDNISIIHINCRSLLKNFHKVCALLHNIKVSVVAVTEIWLTDYTADIVKLPGYKFVCKCRPTEAYGGVGFFIADTIDFNVVELPVSVNKDVIECLFIEIVSAMAQNIIVGSIYRPHGKPVENFTLELENILACNKMGKNKNIFLAGDFNIDLLKMDAHEPTKQFFEMLLSHHLLPTMYRPTRITPDTATLIDNIFTNAVSKCVKASIVYSDISDHLPVAIQCNVSVGSRRTYYSYKRLFSADRIAEFNRVLAVCNWSDVTVACANNDPDSAYSIFQQIYLKHYNNIFPLQKKAIPTKHVPKQVWITPALIKSCNKKSQLYKSCLRNPTPENKAKFHTYRNKLKSLMRAAEKLYYADLFTRCRSDLRATWTNIKAILHGSSASEMPKTFFKDNKSITGSKNIADSFNEYFVNVGATLAAKIQTVSTLHTNFMPKSNVNSFYLLPTDTAEITSICKNLKDKNSAGCEGIVGKYAKLSINNISKPLCDIINCSFQTGIVPSEIKIAKIVPIYKTGAKDLFSNYRPISILPFFSKLFEKLVHDRLMTFLNQWNILSCNQYGFRKNCSTYMALMDICDKITESLDKNQCCAGIFIDLSKAFDTIDHSILIKKTRTLWHSRPCARLVCKLFK